MCSKSDRYQLWGGCFSEEPSDVLRRMNDSLAVDSRLFHQDIEGSKAWAKELNESGHLSDEDCCAIQDGLDQVETNIEADLTSKGRLLDPEEDIHSVVERRLHDRIGEPALRLHTARSRNDQSATDTRLWMIQAQEAMLATVGELIQTLQHRAVNETDIIIPGYTHLQRAQPVRWSHFILSHAWTFCNDLIRLKEQGHRLSQCPLGSGAIAGCALPINRLRLAKNLGFETVTPNSMFAVSSRDHIVEFVNWASLCGIHLSRLAEDLILYGSQEFGVIRLSDQFSTGSSLMPQKRNPDGLELVRGAAGLLLGDSVSLNCILKGLPSTYNKDLQADKEILFRCHDRIMDALKVTIGSIKTMTVNKEKGLSLLDTNMLATDLAHWLVRRGVPFRSAHHIVGSILKRATALGLDLKDLPHKEYVAICPDFGSEEELRRVFSWEASVEQYTSSGGTSMSSVQQQLTQMKKWLKEYNS